MTHLADAQRVIEHALEIDPLNIELHHRREPAAAPSKEGAAVDSR